MENHSSSELSVEHTHFEDYEPEVNSQEEATQGFDFEELYLEHLRSRGVEVVLDPTPVPQERPLPKIDGALGELPLACFDPRCFTPADPRLQHLVAGLIPSDPLTREISMTWLHRVMIVEESHWSEYVEYFDPEESFLEDMDIYFYDEPVIVEADLLVTNLLSVYEEEVIEQGFADPNFFDFSSDDVVKSFESPTEYKDSVVGKILQERNFNVVMFGPHKFAFYPCGGQIPNNFDAIRMNSVSGYMPEGLQSYLMGYSMRRDKYLSYKVFEVGSLIVEPIEEADPPVLGAFEVFSSALDEGITSEPEPPARPPPRGGKDGGAAGFARFKEDSKDVVLPVSREECFLESDDLNGLFENEDSALAVNAAMSGGIIQSMNGRVVRYLDRVGWFYLAGGDRYVMMYRLLHISGAFSLLRRKFKDNRSYLLAMKVWLFRSSLVADPHANKISFVSI